MEVNWLRSALLAVVIAVSTVVSSASYADETPANGIEEIIVTATKRDVRPRDAPLSVSVMASRALADAAVRDIFDVASLVPSFSATQSTGPLSTSWFIRRIGNLGSIPNFESAVGVFVDGAFRIRAGSSIGDLFDLRQVEVVRGPQTTLHGKNTTAGLVSIWTNPPDATPDLRGTLTAGILDASESAKLLRFEGVVNAPLTSTVSARAGGVIYRHDATLTNLFNDDHGQDARRYTVRGQLRYSGSERLDARLIANRIRIDSAKLGDIVLFEGNAIRGINEAFGVPCPEHDIDDRLFCRNDASVMDLTSNDITLNIRNTHGDVALYSISSFEDYDSVRDFDGDQLNIDVVRIVDRQRGSGFSQELRIARVADAGAGWLLGVFFLDSDFVRGSAAQPTVILGPDAANLELLPGLPVGSAGDAGFFDSRSDTRHVSVFANVDWSLSDAFSVTAGLRWQQEHKRTSILNTANHTGPTVITLRLMPDFADASLSRDMSGTSWELTGRYRWNAAWTAYLLASHGIKSGGFNGGFGAIPPESREFADETVDTVELGLKSELMDGRLRFDSALFSTRYRNFQSAGWVSLRFLVNNAERVDVHGVEFSLHTELSEQLAAGASLSWVDASYDRYTNGSCYFNRTPDNVDGTACDLSGRVLPLAPRTRSNINLAYQRALRGATLYGHIDWTRAGKYFTNSTLDPRHVQGTHSLLNASIGLRFDRFEVSAWIRNATDQLVVMREGPSNLFPGDPAYGRAFAMPRSYGLTVSARL